MKTSNIITKVSNEFDFYTNDLLKNVFKGGFMDLVLSIPVWDKTLKGEKLEQFQMATAKAWCYFYLYDLVLDKDLEASDVVLVIKDKLLNETKEHFFNSIGLEGFSEALTVANLAHQTELLSRFSSFDDIDHVKRLSKLYNRDLVINRVNVWLWSLKPLKKSVLATIKRLAYTRQVLDDIADFSKDTVKFQFNLISSNLFNFVEINNENELYHQFIFNDCFWGKLESQLIKEHCLATETAKGGLRKYAVKQLNETKKYFIKFNQYREGIKSQC